MRNLRVGLVCVAVFLFIVGCSSSMMLTQDYQMFPEPTAGKAMVYFYRPSAFTGAIISYDVYSGDEKIGGIKNGTYFFKELDPGNYEFWAKTEAKKNVMLEVVADQTYYVKCGIGFGLFVGRPKFEIVPEVTGSNEIKTAKYSTLK